MERVIRREYTPAGETIKTELLRTPEKKQRSGWLRVLAWQTAISLALCLGAWGLGHWATVTAEQVRSAGPGGPGAFRPGAAGRRAGGPSGALPVGGGGGRRAGGPGRGGIL